jgi:hypothetical protein
MYPNWGSQRLFPPRSKKFGGRTEAVPSQSVDGNLNGGWGFAAWVISHAGLSRDGLMLPLRLQRIAVKRRAIHGLRLSSTFHLKYFAFSR